MSDANFANEMELAAETLRSGGVLALPTDTLYGLGADIFNEKALQRVFQIKGRPEELALPALLGDLDQLGLVVKGLSEAGLALARRFWPGPLTLVTEKAKQVPDLATAGKPTLAVRIPDHRVPLALAKCLGRPITGTSANLSGGPDLNSLEEIQRLLGSSLDYVVQSGPPPKGTASTLVDVTAGEIKILREGALSSAEIFGAIEGLA